MCLKEECVTDEEDGADNEVAGEEKQTERERIYSDAQEEHQRTPERGVHDENGTNQFVFFFSFFFKSALPPQLNA